MEAGAALRLWGWLCARVTNSVFRNDDIPTVDTFAINAEAVAIRGGKFIQYVKNTCMAGLLALFAAAPPVVGKVLRTVLKGKTVYAE